MPGNFLPGESPDEDVGMGATGRRDGSDVEHDEYESE